ncbi:hypothetical protein E4198_09105 [Streptomyces sp. RKND-216]|uniref:hypothetical protein n=1 Tax=Streptomyces sp. RKND-216 TaxID=2562581 RepID=UPI00109E321D|nr:hypothetical protein [Streptomyces sp. RKND-216]THA24863.1 hypothetical protein E4198_09105 [Streptomyces sp. RKND-216]
MARYTGAPVPPRPENREEALHLLFDLAADRPLPVVLDESPYLVRNAPALPSQLQAAIGVRGGRHLTRHPRILLCGSACPSWAGC